MRPAHTAQPAHHVTCDSIAYVGLQAYGAGVYLGSSTTMSLGYCGGRPARHGSSKGAGVAPVTVFPSELGSSNDFGCMALCEVINGSDTNAHGSRSHSIHVVPDNAMVRI